MMLKQSRAIFSLLLSLYIFAISNIGSGLVYANDLHVMTAHQVAVDHHHHDSSSLHMDHEDVNTVHQHTVDYPQNLAVLCDSPIFKNRINVSRVHLAQFEQPASAFIEAPFRPPQLPI